MIKRTKISKKKFKPISTIIRGGKRYIILRDKKGRISESTKWRKDFTIKEAIKRINKTGSIKLGVKKTRLTNVVEVVDLRPKLRYPKKLRFQGYAKIETDDGTFEGRSMQTTNKQTAIKEAIMNASLQATDYDNDDAEAIFQKVRSGQISSNFGIVYYQPVSA